jgi:hypothetical protein
MDTNCIETTTWHDMRPSHNPRPDNLLDLEYRMNKAWQDYDALIERRYEWYAGIQSDEVTHEMIQMAQDAAVQAQQTYWDAWYQANSDYCTCLPDGSGVTCDTCKAQSNRKSQERIIENV